MSIQGPFFRLLRFSSIFFLFFFFIFMLSFTCYAYLMTIVVVVVCRSQFPMFSFLLFLFSSEDKHIKNLPNQQLPIGHFCSSVNIPMSIWMIFYILTLYLFCVFLSYFLRFVKRCCRCCSLFLLFNFVCAVRARFWVFFRFLSGSVLLMHLINFWNPVY